MKRWNNASLGTRLSVLYVGLLALLLATLGGFFYYETRGFLLSSTATRLRAQAKPVIERRLAPELARTATQPAAQGALAQVAAELSRELTSRDTVASVLDAQGRLLADGRRLAEEPAPVAADARQVALALAGDNEVTFVLPAGAGRPADALVLLIPLRRAPAHDQIVGVAQLVAPLDAIEEILLRERLVISLGVLAALLAGAIGGLWLTRTGLRPLRRMIVICRDIAAGDLSQRVHLSTKRDEVGQLAEAFNDMVARIEAAFAAQRRFVADAAHELRTPLAALQGSLEVFLRGTGEAGGPSQQRLAQGMYREARRLTRLAEQLLDLTGANIQPPLAREQVDLAALLEPFMHNARPLTRGRRLELDAGEPMRVTVDTDMLQQALFHLVDNAARHTAKGGAIHVGWAHAGEQVRLWVADDGQGIAAQDLPQIFEPFYRGDRSRARERGGAGLGLALVRRIAHAHGGEVEVQSTLGQGARFTLVLPLRGYPPVHPAPET